MPLPQTVSTEFLNRREMLGPLLELLPDERRPPTLVLDEGSPADYGVPTRGCRRVFKSARRRRTAAVLPIAPPRRPAPPRRGGAPTTGSLAERGGPQESTSMTWLQVLDVARQLQFLLFAQFFLLRLWAEATGGTENSSSPTNC